MTAAIFPDRADATAPHGKVMVYVHDLRTSGVVRNTLAIARKVAERYEVVLVAGHRDGYLLDEAAAGPWRLVTLADDAGGGWAAIVRRLRRLVRAERPDVLLSTGNRGHWTVRPAVLGLRRPLRLYRISNSIDRHGDGRAGVRGIGFRLLAADAHRLFLVGQATATAPQFGPALAEGRVDVLANGIDRERARRRASEARTPAGVTPAEPYILSIGRFAPQKDFPTLIRAAAIVARERPLTLVIIGKGGAAERQALVDAAQAAGLGDRLILPGETDNVFAWLAQAAAFVLPSRWEGSSMALLEALAVGTPIVTTRQAGDAAHVLDDGRYGLLVEAGDETAMAAAIRRQLSDERVVPGDRAAAFDADTVIARYAAAIDRAVGEARSPH